MCTGVNVCYIYIYIYILVRTAEDRKILLEHLLFLSVVQINIKIFGKYIYNTVAKSHVHKCYTHTHTAHTRTLLVVHAGHTLVPLASTYGLTKDATASHTSHNGDCYNAKENTCNDSNKYSIIY